MSGKVLTKNLSPAFLLSEDIFTLVGEYKRDIFLSPKPHWYRISVTDVCVS